MVNNNEEMRKHVEKKVIFLRFTLFHPFNRYDMCRQPIWDEIFLVRV